MKTSPQLTKKIRRRASLLSDDLTNSQLHPVLKTVYANRQVVSLKQIDYKLSQLLNFLLLKDSEKAAKIIVEAIIKNQRIIVVGDFDTDGATSTALVIRCLRAFGFNNVDYLVPNRFDFGYGLSPEIVDVAASMHGKKSTKVDIIITVDNGISSVAGVKAANALGIQVIITDHHLCADELPDAAAIVNPNQVDCQFPEKSIAGVGVAFYLMLGVRAQLRKINYFNARQKEPNLANFLDLVALGTVADVVALEYNNRILVEAGLNRIRNNQLCAGIKALLSIAGKSAETCSTQEFGFIIAPRLNAAGRLDDMSVGIECLLTDDNAVASNYAKMLNQMNIQRRDIEKEMLTQALKFLEKKQSEIENKNIPVAFSLFDEQWHQGVVGLLASRIKDKYHRPVFAFAKSGNNELKGSGRSIAGLHLRDILDEIDKHDSSVIKKFGGHAMAAGLTINAEKFPIFEKLFIEKVSNNLQAETLNNIIETDGSIAIENFNLATAKTLKFASPWGQLFPEPLFDDDFFIVNWKIVAEKHLKLVLKHVDGKAVINAIAFNKTEVDLPATKKVHFVYRLDVNEFRDKESLQLIIQQISPVTE